MLRTSLGAAEPELANTAIQPPAKPGLVLNGDETNDQRPSAVTATPNGSPETEDIRTSAAGSRGPPAVLVLHPGLPWVMAGVASRGRPALATGLGAGEVAGAVF